MKFLICALMAFQISADLASDIDALAESIEDRVIDWRRDIHQHPELSNREFRTAALVAKHLEALGLEVRTGVAHTGVVGILRGGRSGRVVALRADMDALPVEEATGLPYASKVRTTFDGLDVGVMHACGHDNHVAILMGAAEVLAGVREGISGTVKFIFQPAEEGPPQGEEGGARLMVEQGVLEDPDVEAIFGLHVSQLWAAGQAAFKPFGMMASAQRFEITVTGSQVHGAWPWQGVDPVVVGSHIVTTLQTIVSRQIDITASPAVVTVGTFHAGVRSNIIPGEARLTGTIRTFDPYVREDVHRRIRRIAKQVAESMGAVATVKITKGVGVTYNDGGLAERMRPTLQRVFGATNVSDSGLIMGAEDFSAYQEEVPGLFFFIGVRPPDVPANKVISNHSPLFYADEDALGLGVRALALLAVDFLALPRD